VVLPVLGIDILVYIDLVVEFSLVFQPKLLLLQ
jgi:hypothetical protein